jgi:hypothetical protein
MKRLLRKHAPTKMKNIEQKTSYPRRKQTVAQCKPGKSVQPEHIAHLPLTPIAPKCFSAAYFLRVFTGTPASNDARCGQEFSQRLFASVCDHKTLSGSISIAGLNCRIERARAANQCLHGLTLVRKSSLEQLLNRHSRQQAAYQNQWAIHATSMWADGLDASEACPNRVALSIGGHRATPADTPRSWEWIPGKRNLTSHSTGR